MNVYCEVCDCHIKKSNWGKHLKTTKHGIACGEIVVEEVEKKQCWKCRGHKGLEMFRGGNATCNGCLAHREKWARNNAEKVRELWQKYHAEHREEINEKKKVYNQLEVDCAVCGCRVRKNKWARHVRTRKHMLGVEGGGGDGKVGGDVGGQRVGWTDHQGYSLLSQCEAFYEMPSFVCRLPEPQCRAASGSIPTARADWPARSSLATCHAVPHLGTASTRCARNDTCENMMNYGILL